MEAQRISARCLFVCGLVVAMLSAPAAWAQGGGDTCAGGTVVTGLPFVDSGTTYGATDDYNEICPDYTGQSGAPDVVYVYTPPSDIDIDIDLCESSYDTRVYVYEGSCPAYDSGLAVACNEDYCGANGWRSRLPSVPLTGGTTYYIVVDGYGSTDSGDYALVIDEAAIGACCDTGTGVCDDAVEEVNCTGRFAADTLCTELDPPCGALPGDVCGTALPIAGLPFTGTGTTVGAGDDYNEICPDVEGSSGAGDVVYVYTPGSDVVVSIDLCESSYDTRVYVYEGSCPEIPDSGEAIACNEDSTVCTADNFRSHIDAVAFTGGVTYYIVVDGYDSSAMGPYVLTVDETTEATGACCYDSSAFCEDAVGESVCEGRFAADTLCADLDPPCGTLAGDDCPTATVVPDIPYTTTGTTAGATDNYDAACDFPSQAPDVVYAYTPAGNRVVDISLCNSSYDTKLYVFAGDCDDPSGPILCNEDACGSDGLKSELRGVPFDDGTTYYIVVDGFGSGSGLYELSINPSEVPSGACCDNSSGVCTDDITQTQCDGRFVADTLCADLDPACGASPPLVCDPGAFFGQDPHGPTDPWSGPISEQIVGGYVYDNFAGVTGPIDSVVWYGFQVESVDLTTDCAEPTPYFEIDFWQDLDGRPDALICSQHGQATAWPSGTYYDAMGTPIELIRYQLDFPTSPCIVGNGWVSIRGGGSETCWFMWVSSPTGDGLAWSSDAGGTLEQMNMDLAICISGSGGSPVMRVDQNSLTDLCPVDPIRSFTVYNDGTGDLDVSTIITPEWVTSINPSGPFTVAPSGGQNVDVTIDCCYCAGRGRLHIFSNDPAANPYPGGVYVNTNVLPGDADDDCNVDLQDYGAFQLAFGETNCHDPGWCDQMDMDQDSDVDLTDLSNFSMVFTGSIAMPPSCP